MGARPKPGDNQYTVGTVIPTVPIKTSKELAKELGVSESTYYQAKQMSNNIVPEVKDAIKAADLLIQGGNPSSMYENVCSMYEI